MNVLCVIRQVPDGESKLRINNGKLDLDGVTLIMDGMDEYGVEQALRLREGGASVEQIIVLAVGPAKNEDAIRTALAMGADRAIHVETGEFLDPIALSKVVAQVAQEENVQLIFTGGQQSDWDSQALGAATAERLSWPQVTWTNQLELSGETLQGKHDIDEGAETFEVELPAIITTQQGLNDPRYPTLPNIMKAKKKELRKETLDKYGVQAKVQHVQSSIQVKERKNHVIDGKDPQAAAAQLIELLRNEAKVIS